MEKEDPQRRRLTVVHRFLADKVNPAGRIHGGYIMSHMDHVAAMLALRYSRHRVVTASMEHMSFTAPLFVGELFFCYASVNRAHGTSMEIGIRGEAEDPFTGKTRHVVTCYLNFVGVGEDGKPMALPTFTPETEEDIRRMQGAARRMALSRMERKQAFPLPGPSASVALSSGYCFCRVSSSAELHTLFARADALSRESFSAYMRDESGIMMVVENKVAEELAILHPGVRLEKEVVLACEKEGRKDSGGSLFNASIVLSSVGIKSYLLPFEGREYLVVLKASEETVALHLQGAGYICALQ